MGPAAMKQRQRATHPPLIAQLKLRRLLQRSMPRPTLWATNRHLRKLLRQRRPPHPLLALLNVRETKLLLRRLRLLLLVPPHPHLHPRLHPLLALPQ